MLKKLIGRLNFSILKLNSSEEFGPQIQSIRKFLLLTTYDTVNNDNSNRATDCLSLRRLSSSRTITAAITDYPFFTTSFEHNPSFGAQMPEMVHDAHDSQSGTLDSEMHGENEGRASYATLFRCSFCSATVWQK